MHKCVNNSIGNVYHLEQMVSDFFPYSQEKLGFDKPATIIFQGDKNNSMKMLGKTAYYDPENYSVTLYVDGRHPKDVMRSLSHELVHHAQNCRGDFTGAEETYEGYAQKDPYLRKMEREAYTKGNLIFRDYEDLIKTGKKDVDIDFSKSGEPKMSLKEWKNNEINSRLMKKWGFLKEEERELLKEGRIPEREPELEPQPESADYGAPKEKGGPPELRYEAELEEGWGWRDEDGGEDDEIEEGKGLEEAGMSYRDDEDSTAKLPAVKETLSRKISVREAKEITRRIIERLRKEGK